MGNCQAVDAAALVIQHPNGKLERMYSSVTASEVMKTNPGHYVSLIIPLPVSGAGEENVDHAGRKTVRFTRVKLLRPHDVLVLGRAYRLVATQEVMKVVRAKKHAKLKKLSQSELMGENNADKSSIVSEREAEISSAVKTRDEATIRPERQHRRRSRSTENVAAVRPKSWLPSLQSISESGS